MLSSGEILVMIALAVIIATYILLPLVPAAITYRLTPGNKIAVKGIFAGLKVNASGSFAAYLVVVAAMTPIMNRAVEFAGSLLHPAWTIRGSFLVIDKDGKAWHPGEQFTQNIHLRTMPLTTDFQDVIVTKDDKVKGSFLFTIPEMSSAFPTIFVRTSYGQVPVEMDLDSIDRFNKTAVMKNPITIVEPRINNSDDRQAVTVPLKN